MTDSKPFPSSGSATPGQIETLQHSLGIDRDKRVPWRNHYCDEDWAPKLEALVAMGLMWHGMLINGGRDRIYHVTPAGEAVAIAGLPEPRTRAQERYSRYLDAADAYPGLTFREFLQRKAMSNPSPEPSAESLAEARGLCSAKSTHWLDSKCGQCAAIAAALASAKRSALGRAVELLESNPVWQRRDLRKALRALMEAE